MNYLAQVDDDTAEIARLFGERDHRDPTDERQAAEQGALDARIAALAVRRDALLASIPALEDLDHGVSAAAERHTAARKSFRGCAAETLRRNWPAPVLLATAITASLCGMAIFPPTWNGGLAAGGTCWIAGDFLACLWELLRLGLAARRGRREHAELVARHSRMMADITTGRPAHAVTW